MTEEAARQAGGAGIELPAGVRLSDDPADIDLDLVHRQLAASYWSPGVARETVARAIRHSLVFSAYAEGRQIAFARVTGDRATVAYLADVFVVDDWRGRGVGAALIAFVHAHPDLQGMRRWLLATSDAFDLYARFGYRRIAPDQPLMERKPGPPA